ncbi:MAG TPA: exodeoxyribonuclease VII small subunit [Saprospiraceae bacterium]|nr:exodeoxyribonuclease VII small subunit [Saprospiraceae bacterium]
MKYDKAFKELQEIVDKLQSGEVSLDSLTKDIKKAKELLNTCKNQLRNIELAISEEE